MQKALTPMEDLLATDKSGHQKRTLLDQIGTHLTWTRHQLNAQHTPEVFDGFRSLYIALQNAEEVIKATNN